MNEGTYIVSFLAKLGDELLNVVMRTISGRLFTDQQIKTIISGANGKYFADVFPTPRHEQEPQPKVDVARKHIAAASSIILEMRQNLMSQNQDLERLLKETGLSQVLATAPRMPATVFRRFWGLALSGFNFNASLRRVGQHIVP
jgi:hypothetical protein